ncbi:class I SAM-dependent methyltransferase [Streptomyces spectabilis]|uniref:SAM-dependent methyltransferase n=1 Tax=Streptomyces spectabilis TaxID=68270 RepID=A0A5P2XM27_STRST|nr:class I SAM-dependent methyltransferase [Streptomyces spectabilis]MBB5102573.1 SAM-dependent methyltransferase [Streptomyces spectabilis]MCI3907612.1 class I SAM-dependent methyltransferase [Streptomyces spectabilis]QEV64299.1 class I SAM-dependent methyltransferase [Streptomyces spectabilis]GGV31058.1 hypothetical protein GCM10010245_50270 [Streptomyces spectabilis]
MSDSYAGLSAHYDLIMTSGYYDYDAYARALITLIGDRRELLELGVGTGLVCAKLLGLKASGLTITGIDHTESMLAQARRRLGERVRLVAGDIREPVLTAPFQAAYSVGGIWYFIHDEQNDAIMLGSHLVTEEDNATALAHLHDALAPDGILALAVQVPHHAYERPLPGGLVYAQEVRQVDVGVFVKDYYVKQGGTEGRAGSGEIVAHMCCPYRVFPAGRAERLLTQCGFRSEGPTGDGLFRQFTRQ